MLQMMEGITINTNEHVASKATLWADRIHAFQKSGLSRKVWCQQNEIPQFTRVLDSDDSVRERRGVRCFWPVIRQASYGTGIGCPYSYRNPACDNPSPGKYLEWSWGKLPDQTHGRVPAGFERLCQIFPKVQRSIWRAEVRIFARTTPAWCNHQTKVPSRPVFLLYVRFLQSQTYIAQNPQWDGSRFCILMKGLDWGRISLAAPQMNVSR